jgi:hypothetical protein
VVYVPDQIAKQKIFLNLNIKTMRKTELIVSLILKDFFYYVTIFLILYYIYQMDKKGRKAIRDKNKVD